MPENATDSLLIAAGADAFGDGAHPSTRGVLEALAMIDPTAFCPRRACDMGAGSGIISLALVRKFACPVVAADIAPRAVAAMRANAAHNGVACLPLPPGGEAAAGGIFPLHADGFTHPELAAHAPYDLIVMNILPVPLRQLAVDADAHLARGGVLILAGIQEANEAMIIDSYQSFELELTARLCLDGWVTLVWQKP